MGAAGCVSGCGPVWEFTRCGALSVGLVGGFHKAAPTLDWGAGRDDAGSATLCGLVYSLYRPTTSVSLRTLRRVVSKTINIRHPTLQL